MKSGQVTILGGRSHFPLQVLASLAVDAFPIDVCFDLTPVSRYCGGPVRKFLLCLGLIVHISPGAPGALPDALMWGSSTTKLDNVSRPPLRKKDLVLHIICEVGRALPKVVKVDSKDRTTPT